MLLLLLAVPGPGTRPLEPSEIRTLRAGLSRLDPYDPGRLTVETIFLTGMHPVAVGNPAWYRVKMRDDGQLEWTRPKKKRRGGDPSVYIPVPAYFRAQLATTILEYTYWPRHPDVVTRIVHDTCETFGMRWVNSRALRHTFGQMAWWKFHDLRLVARWLACSMSTAARYANAELTAEKEVIMREGWFDAPLSPIAAGVLPQP